jgi:hypothetical protein
MSSGATSPAGPESRSEQHRAPPSCARRSVIADGWRELLGVTGPVGLGNPHEPHLSAHPGARLPIRGKPRGAELVTLTSGLARTPGRVRDSLRAWEARMSSRASPPQRFSGSRLGEPSGPGKLCGSIGRNRVGKAPVALRVRDLPRSAQLSRISCPARPAGWRTAGSRIRGNSPASPDDRWAASPRGRRR